MSFQIDHIFSDKTGTLTQNLMTLRHWFVNGHIVDENGDGEIGKYARGEKGDAEDAKLFSLFLRSISVCHTIVPAVDEKTDSIILFSLYLNPTKKRKKIKRNQRYH